MMREAMLYEPLADQRVQCHLCAHQCRINPTKHGICGVRQNREGVLYALTYGMLIAENVDPIEKKPLFHVYPASKSFSIATAGCNFSCEFCQNHEISQLQKDIVQIPGRPTLPADIVERAVRTGSRTISYTYTEPTIYFEYAFDTACLAQERGLKNVFVTNGYMTDEALKTFAPYLHAANVDLKSFRDDFYRRQCGAHLAPVLESLRKMKDMGIWVEATTLLIPGLNDSEDELHDIASFIFSLGSETPWHISRFHPRYRMQRRSATPSAAIHQAVEIGRACGLKYVYSGNIPGDEAENTFCYHCGLLLIGRHGFHIEQMNLDDSACIRCGTTLEGIF
jgi:pyruvate formate lyase activating enzyme